MGVLFKYELRKVLCKKSYVIALFIMMLILVANECTPVLLGNYKVKKEAEMALSKTVINDDYLSGLKPKEEHNTTDPIEFFIKASTGQTDISGHTEEELYNSRKEINDSMLKADKISEKNIEIWKKWDSENVAPFTYYYSGSYSAFMEIAGYMNFMLLIVTGVGLSGLFADEKATNMDQLIFCSKEGRTRLFGVKLAVGTVIGLVTFSVLMITELVTCLILYGVEGAQMMIQLVIPQCMLHMNMGQACIAMTFLLLFEEMAFVVIVLTMSQLTMNRAITISSMFVVMFCGMLNIPENLGILYLLWNAIPGATVGSWLFNNYQLISIGGLHLTNLIYIPIIWLIVGTGMFFLVKYLYSNYQVKSR